MDDRNESLSDDTGSAEPKLLFLGTPEAQGKLFEAIGLARKSFRPVKNDTQGMMGNRTYKYADLQTLVEATSDALSDNGVTILQFMTGPNQDGTHRVTTVVAGHSAQLHSLIDYKRAGDIKSWGSQTTYLRRYSYRAILILDGSDDADTTDMGRGEPQDARRSQATPPKPPPKPEPKKAPPPAPVKEPQRPEPDPRQTTIAPLVAQVQDVIKPTEPEEEKTIVDTVGESVSADAPITKELKETIKNEIINGASKGIDKAFVDGLCQTLLGKSGQQLFQTGTMSEGAKILEAIRDRA